MGIVSDLNHSWLKIIYLFMVLLFFGQKSFMHMYCDYLPVYMLISIPAECNKSYSACMFGFPQVFSKSKQCQ